MDLGNGFALLRARDEHRHQLVGAAARAVHHFLEKKNGPSTGTTAVKRWARLWLPNGQIARSAWKECRKPLEKLRMSRNVKVCSCMIFC
jgi:hypothetical protein